MFIFVKDERNITGGILVSFFPLLIDDAQKIQQIVFTDLRSNIVSVPCVIDDIETSTIRIKARIQRCNSCSLITAMDF